MAKKIVLKKTGKKISHSVSIDGKNVTIETGCKTFGNCLINDESGDLIGKCKTCAKKFAEVCEACLVKTDPKFAVIEKKAKKAASVNYALIFNEIAAGKTVKTIMAEKADLFNTEGACKSFVSTCSSAYKAATKGGASKMALYAAWLKNEKKGDCPDILPKSKRFTEMAVKFVAAV